MKKIHLLIGSYIAVIVGLFLYSYTQVDLNLTLTRLPIWQGIQKSFQYIGYFQRPLSTGIYISIVLLLFGCYGLFLYLAAKKKITKKQIWVIIGVTTGLLTFSYNAFSYDVFNYIFDAKIVTFYHQNPYLHTALDYPLDPMLGFMHWVQRSYPYGPTWLGITIPLSFIGKNIFILTFFLFKVCMSIFFLLSVYFTQKISEKISPDNSLFTTILFALNPLVIIESLVSSHHEIVMIGLILWSIDLLISKKYVRSILLFLLSVGIKFVTVFFTPIYLFVLYSRKKEKKVNWSRVFIISSLLMIIPIILESFRTNFQPWYLLNALPFAALIGKKKYVVIPVCICSFAALMIYVPFLYLGNWDSPVPTILFWIMTGGVIFSALGVGFSTVKRATMR